MSRLKLLAPLSLAFLLSARLPASVITMSDYDMSSDSTVDGNNFGNYGPSSPSIYSVVKLVFSSGVTFSGDFVLSGLKIYDDLSFSSHPTSLLVGTSSCGPLTALGGGANGVTCNLTSPTDLHVTPLWVVPVGVGHIFSSNTDNFAVDLQPQAVTTPEPASLGVVGLSLCLFALALRKAV